MNVNTYLHKYLKGYLKPDMTVVDMTMGNGNDTLFLAQNSLFVYAFDIQRDAVQKTYNRLNGLNNYSLLLDNHLNFDDYIDVDEASLFVYNLGFLPGGNKEIITESNNTLETFIKSYEYLKTGGLICITFYFHQGGYDEYYKVLNYIKNNNLKIIETYREKKENSPYLFIIQKI